jgi:hypothetical protein
LDLKLFGEPVTIFVVRFPLFLAMTLSLLACDRDGVAPPTPASVSSPKPEPQKKPEPPKPEPSRANEPSIEFSNVGPLVRGEPVDEAKVRFAFAGHTVGRTSENVNGTASEVFHVKSPKESDRLAVAVWPHDGKLDHIDIFTDAIKTKKGIGVGSTFEELQSAYPTVDCIVGDKQYAKKTLCQVNQVGAVFIFDKPIGKRGQVGALRDQKVAQIGAFFGELVIEPGAFGPLEPGQAINILVLQRTFSGMEVKPGKQSREDGEHDVFNVTEDGIKLATVWANGDRLARIDVVRPNIRDHNGLHVGSGYDDIKSAADGDLQCEAASDPHLGDIYCKASNLPAAFWFADPRDAAAPPDGQLARRLARQRTKALSWPADAAP